MNANPPGTPGAGASRRLRTRLAALALCALGGAAAPLAAAPTANGFDLAGALVPVDQIEHGGPPRDGIPAIDEPRFVPADDAGFLAPEDRVLGLVVAGEARAYPVAILNWHEIVNDRIAGTPVAVTYCPLCGTGVAYRAEADGRPLAFGVSGLLYNSDVLLFDRQTDSLWSQILNRAVTGPMRGRSLTMLPLEHTSWRHWRDRHPETRVLSTETGHRRDYSRDPYADYRRGGGTLFPVASFDRRFPEKTWVVGIVLDGRAKVYPFPELERLGTTPLVDRVGDRPLRVIYDRAGESVRLEDGDGRPLPGVTAYWFAWMAFHPDSEVFHAPSTTPAKPATGGKP